MNTEFSKDKDLLKDLSALDALLPDVSMEELSDMEAALKDVRKKASRDSGIYKIRRYWPIAVAAAAAVAVFVMVGRFSAPSTVKEETVYRFSNVESTPMRINLPDGSEVWLKAGSEMEYSKDFNVTQRSVRLVGEAYFDVSKNPSMPFYVNTPSLRVKVLGTVFNVKDREGNAPEVVLAKGSVVMQNQEGANIIRLKPGQKAEWDEKERTFDVEEVPGGNLLLLNYGVISLKEVTAAEIAAVISDTFDVRINASGNALGRTYNFSFQKGASPESVVELLNFICKDQFFVIVR